MGEVPLEHTQEEMMDQAREAPEKWTLGVALTAAILAALAAVTALLGEHHVNEALIDQIRASDHWSHYQAKSIKSNLLDTKAAILGALHQGPAAHDQDKHAEYDKELADLMKDARADEKSSKQHLERHEPLARGLTMFQLAIAVGAISVLTRRKAFWWAAIAMGLVGAFFLATGTI